LVGVIDESNLLDHLLTGGDVEAAIEDLATQNFATAELNTSLATLAPQLKVRKVVLAMDGERVIGVISQIDVLERMAAD
ncbi:MAG: CBS domain-containing protein, partial [Myxococcota bacterium]|nr:CBS domain-containing protein [Myxococcota bacterium]